MSKLTKEEIAFIISQLAERRAYFKEHSKNETNKSIKEIDLYFVDMLLKCMSKLQIEYDILDMVYYDKNEKRTK